MFGISILVFANLFIFFGISGGLLHAGFGREMAALWPLVLALVLKIVSAAILTLYALGMLMVVIMFDCWAYAFSSDILRV